jgi:hypothetical protein
MGMPIRFVVAARDGIGVRYVPFLSGRSLWASWAALKVDHFGGRIGEPDCFIL